MPTETQSGLNIKRKLEGAVDALIHSGETENADMAGLASASHANPAVDTAAQSPADSQAGLNIKRKLESAVDALIHSEEPADPAGSSAATSVASPAQSEIQAGLNIKRTLESAVDALIQSSGSESADMEGLAAAGHANPTADQPQFFTQASGLNVKRKLESAVDALIASDEAPLEQSPAESLERSKFTLKKTSEAASATPAATEAPAKKAKTVAMHERPHYRNQGGGMVHTEPTVRKPATPEQDAALAAAKERSDKAATLAEARAEVESAFHMSTPERAKTSEEPRAAGSWFGSFVRGVLLLGALASMGALGYQKFSMIRDIYEGKQGPCKFGKAKKEDMTDLFGDRPQARSPTRFVPEVATNFMESTMNKAATARSGLISRRGAAETNECSV